MDRWKSRGGKSQRRQEKKREDQRRERVRREKMQVHEKVEKSRVTVFFQWFVAPEGRKVGSLKRRVRRHLVRWEMNKLHAVVARSTFRSQNVKTCKNKPGSEHFWKLRCRKAHVEAKLYTKHLSFGAPLEVETSKKCTPLWREAHFEVKMYKAHTFRPLGDVEMSKKCPPLWREAHFEVKSVKNWRDWSTFGRADVVLRGRRKGLCTLSKVNETWNLHQFQLQPLHYITLHSIPLHYTTGWSRFVFGDFDSFLYRRNWFRKNWFSIPSSAIRGTIRFETIRFLRIWDSIPERFLIDINSLKCDSISDSDSLFKFDSIICGSIRGFDSISYGSFSIFDSISIIYFIYLFIYIYIHTNTYIRRHTYIY